MMPQSIHISREYPYPIEHIWFALTDSKALATWLMPNNFQARLHHQFQFQTTPRPGFDGIVECEVIEIEAPKLLAYKWKGGPMQHPTTVRWSLESIEKQGTRLTLEHSGFEGVSGFIVKAILGFGWKKLLVNKLEEYFTKSRKLL